MIRGASTLLLELWDGKLKATVRSFSKKVCSDMAVVRKKERSRAVNGQVVKGKSVGARATGTRPSWARWRDEEELKR